MSEEKGCLKTEMDQKQAFALEDDGAILLTAKDPSKEQLQDLKCTAQCVLKPRRA